MSLRAILSKIGFTAASSVLGKCISLITVVLVTQHFTMSTYGQYVLYLSYAIVACAIFPAILGVLFTVEQTQVKSRGGAQQLRQLQGEGLTVTWLVLLCVVVVFGAVLHQFIGTTLLWYALLALVGVRAFYLYLQTILRAYDCFHALAIIAITEVIAKLLTTAYIIYGAGADQYNPLQQLGWLVVTDAVAVLSSVILYSVVAYRQAWRPGLRRISRTSPLWNLFKRQGWWQMARVIITHINGQLYLWLIAITLSPAAVGLFSIARRLFQFAKVLMPLQPILTTFFAQESQPKNLKKHVKDILGVLNIIALFFTSAGVVAVSIAPQYLFPEHADALRFVAPIVMCNLLFKGVTYVTSAVLDSQHEQHIRFISNLTTTAYYFLVFTPVAYYFGLEGAAVAMAFNIIPLLFQVYAINSRKLAGDMTYRDWVRCDMVNLQKLIKRKH